MIPLLVAVAQAATHGSDGAFGFGVGISLGEPTGLSFMWRPDLNDAVQVELGWDAAADHMHVHVNYLRNLALLQGSGTPNLTFPVFAGIGGAIELRDRGMWNEDDEGFGIGIPLGIGLVSHTAPFDLFADVTPVVGLVPRTDLDVEDGLQGHFYF